MYALSSAKSAPTFTPKARTILPRPCPSAMRCSNAEAGSRSSAIPRTTRPLSSSARGWGRSIREHAIAGHTSTQRRGNAGQYPASADRAARLHGRHHPYPACRHRAATGVSRGDARLGDRRALGGIAVHVADATLGASLAAAAARGEDSHSKYQTMALGPAFEPDLGADRGRAQRTARPALRSGCGLSGCGPFGAIGALVGSARHIWSGAASRKRCQHALHAPGEQAVVRAVEATSGGAAEGFTGSLAQLIALARRARLFVGGDTGPMHLAAALGVPVVGIFGPTNPTRNGPFGTRSIVLRSPSSPTTHARRAQPDEGLLEISSEQAVAAARQLLRSCHG